MGVELYEPIKPVLLHAALWKGSMRDFVGMPDFNQLVNMCVRIEPQGTLILDLSSQDGLPEERLEPYGHYIVRGITGVFFIRDVKYFESTYQRVPIVRREPAPAGEPVVKPAPETPDDSMDDSIAMETI